PAAEADQGHAAGGQGISDRGRKTRGGGTGIGETDGQGRHMRGVPGEAQEGSEDDPAGLVPGCQWRGPVRLVLCQREAVVILALSAEEAESEIAQLAELLIDAVTSGA